MRLRGAWLRSRPGVRALVLFVRERFPPWISLPLAAILALAALPATDAVGLGRAVLASFALLLAARIVDDLADLEVDRVRSPERVLASGLVAPASLAAWVPVLLVLVAVVTGTWSSILWLAVAAFLGVAYHRGRDRIAPLLRPPLVSVVFLWVPVLVTLGAGGAAAPAVRVGLFAWTGAVAHDYAHDADRHPRPRLAAGLAALAYAGCAGLGALLARTTPRSAIVLVALCAGLVPTAALLARLLREPTVSRARALRIPGFFPVFFPLLVLAAERAVGGAR